MHFSIFKFSWVVEISVFWIQQETLTISVSFYYFPKELDTQRIVKKSETIWNATFKLANINASCVVNI